MMFVRTQFSVCVCVVVQGKAVFTARAKKKVIMIDEEYTICFRFPREKRYSPLMCRKKERIVGCEGQSFIVCCERSKAHS